MDFYLSFMNWLKKMKFSTNVLFVNGLAGTTLMATNKLNSIATKWLERDEIIEYWTGIISATFFGHNPPEVDKVDRYIPEALTKSSAV